jgi:protein-S-isoprenylcysteine O-methyltransferase Ste14
VDAVLARHLLPRGALLYVGSQEKRKNLVTLVMAYMGLARKRHSIPPLVLVGPGSPAEEVRGAYLAAALIFFAAIVWTVRRAWFTPILPLGKTFEVALAILTMALAAGSVWLCISAIRTLGQQWSLAARVIEGHKLVTQGPYSVVRNPIYTGMLGMLLATGLANSHWIGLLIALVLFGIGTAIRVRSEAALLHETFGEEFEKYARTVPAVIPYLI